MRAATGRRHSAALGGGPVPAAWRRMVAAAAGGLLLAGLLGACRESSVPVATVEQGLFEIRLREAGTISAVNSMTVGVPRLRMNLQILWLAEEGTIVEKGDSVVVFDQTEVSKAIEDRQSELELARAALRKGEVTQATEISALHSTLTFDSLSWQLSGLRRERTRYESEVARQEAELQFHQATLSLEKSVARLESQLAIRDEELGGLRLKVEQAEAELRKARRDFEEMIVRAPRRGMVVFLPIWKGDRMGKVKVGDSPWRGSSIIELPDFDTMQVDLSINEADFNLVRVGDSCSVVLDAWPDRQFSGRVTDLGVLARERDDDSGLKAFDLSVRIGEADEILKPGMNARVTIYGLREENRLTVPVEALRQDEEGWFVWAREGGRFERRPVEPGLSNGNRSVIHAGLSVGEEVALSDPASADENR
jgi:HlyD family secretion protein